MTILVDWNESCYEKLKIKQKLIPELTQEKRT